MKKLILIFLVFFLPSCIKVHTTEVIESTPVLIKVEAVHDNDEVISTDVILLR